MGLEIVYGEPRHRAVAVQLAQVLEASVDDGTIYLGYPVLATADERVFIDALLVSAQRGVVAFQIADVVPASAEEWAEIITEQDRLYGVLESHLGRHESLRRNRSLAFTLRTVTVLGEDAEPLLDVGDGYYCSIERVPELISTFDGFDADLLTRVQAALQRVTSIKPQKRRASVSSPTSRGAVLKNIEKGIANLDKWQNESHWV